MRTSIGILFFLFVFEGSAQILQTNISAHDPVMIQQDSIYYLFCTGKGITTWSSKDRLNWQKEKPVFDTIPAWITKRIPGFKNIFWAPDISYYNGYYYLFYAVSIFGQNTSCIGLAVNKTLHVCDSQYRWIDAGKIIESSSGKDRWNAIDPNLIVDASGTPWLSFGSFWEGIKLVQLKLDLQAVQEPMHLFSLARRNAKKDLGDTLLGGGAIEAPFIFKKGKYYYLFVSFDLCCKGLNSTYKIMVGRSEVVNGVYLDKDNLPMTQGGGTLVLSGDKDWSGVGHNAVCTFEGVDYLIFHGYQVSDHGKPKLRIEKLGWDIAGWPVVQ